MFGLFDGPLSDLDNTLDSASSRIKGLGSDKTQLDSPMQSHQWFVELPDLNVPATGAQFISHSPLERTYQRSLDYREVSQRIAAVTTPFPAMTTEKAGSGNSFWIYAKHNELGHLSLEVYEHNDGSTFHYFQTWLDQIKTPDGTYYPPVVWKRDVLVYRTNNVDDQVVKHTYRGTFPINIGDIQSNYETSELTKLSVNFACDSVKTDIQQVDEHSSDLLEALRDKKDQPTIQKGLRELFGG